MAQCLLVGLNPAWQKVLQFNGLHPGEVNRAVGTAECAAGKGLNSARILRQLGHSCDVLQILGGDYGKKILKYCGENQITSRHFNVKNQTRLCVTLLEKNRETELIEPFCMEPHESAQFEKELPDLIPGEKTYESIVFCGSLPRGLKPDTFEVILKNSSAKNIFLDGYSGFTRKFLKEVHFLKINAGELGAMLKAGKINSAEALLESELPDLKLLMVTHGKKPADVYYQDSGRWVHRTLEIPRVPSVNAIGAGDSCHGGLIHSILEGASLIDACKFGLALGSASCMEILPAHFKEQNLQKILSEMDKGVF